MHSLRKILTPLRGPNFCSSSSRFAQSFVRQPNGPKCSQIVRNATKHQFRVQWGGSRLRKMPTRLHGTIFCTTSPCYAPSSVRQPNGTKSTQMYGMYQHVTLVSYKVDQVRSLRKIPTRLRGTNFCTSLPVLHRVP